MVILGLVISSALASETETFKYQSCITSNSEVTGCTQIAGATAGGSATGLDDLVSVAVSPDGKSVYTAAYRSDAVARFDRDPSSGAITYRGCVTSNSAIAGCEQIAGATLNGTDTGLDRLWSVTVSSDGKSVYTASLSGDAVARFDRDLGSGTIAYRGCITSDSGVDGCEQIAGATPHGTNTGLDDLVSVTVSPDGRSVYTAAVSATAVARFDRNLDSGAITYQGCATADSEVAGCTPIAGASAGGTNTGLDDLQTVAVSADGKSVYTASLSGDAVTRFDRDLGSGDIVYQGCITSNSNVASCTQIAGASAGGTNTALNGLVSLAASIDGKSIYVASRPGVVARFARDPSSGAIAYQDCVTDANNYVTGCAQVGGPSPSPRTALYLLQSVAVSTDGRSVYTASEGSHAVARFDRDPNSGTIVYEGCITSDSWVNCTKTPDHAPSGVKTSLEKLQAVAVSADDKSVYTASRKSDAVAGFDFRPDEGSPTDSSDGDTTPPTLRTWGRKVQRLRGAVKVMVSCDEACALLAVGRLWIPRHRGGKMASLAASGGTVGRLLTLRPARANIGAGKKKGLRLRMKSKARRLVKRALRKSAGAQVLARIEIVAMDEASNASTAKRTVKIRP